MSDGFFESSKSIEEKIQKMRDELVIDPNNIQKHRAFAELLLSNQNRLRISEAKSSLRNVLEDNPDDLDAKILEIRAYRLSKDLSKAQELADALHNAYPENPSVLEELGRIHLAKKFYKNAAGYLKKAYQIHPDNERIGRAYWDVLYTDKEYDRALSVASKLVMQNQNARNTQLKVISYSSFNRLDEAVSLLENFQKNFPEEFAFKMWDLDGSLSSLPVNLAISYLESAFKKSDEKNLNVLHYQFDDHDKILFIFNSNAEIDELFVKCLDQCNLILHDVEKEGNENSVELVIRLKNRALLYLQRFEQSSSLIEDQLTKNHNDLNWLYSEGFCNFYLKEYLKSVKSFEKVLLDFPDSMIVLKMLRDTYRVLGDKEAYLEKKKKLEILKEKSENKNVSPKMKDFSIIPGEDFKNYSKVREFFGSRKGGFLKITDRYMTSNYIKTLSETVTMDEIHEIQIIRGMYHTEAGNQFFDDTVELPRMIYKFNRTYEDRCKLTVKVANLHASDHDRYAITSDEVYNIPGLTQMNENKSSDGTPITNKEGVLARRSRFEELWNSKDSVILTSDNWTEILEKLSDMVESDKQELANSVKIALDPTLEHADENKAVRDNVPEILKSKGLNLNFEKKTDENFIRSMHKKIQEELAEYVLADQNHNKIQKKNRKLESQNANLQNTADTKMVKAIEKSIRGLESDVSKLMAEKHIDPLEELTDIVEAAYRMAELRGCSKDEFERLMAKRSDEFGRFDKNWYLYKEKEDSGQ